MIGAVLKTASSGHADLERELIFFKRNRHRMGYYESRSRTLIAGSGTVETANKVLVTQRIKRSGMRWTLDGSILFTDQIVKLTSMYVVKAPRDRRSNLVWDRRVGISDPVSTTV